MTSTVRRAGAFAVAGIVALAAPLLWDAANLPFARRGAAVPFVLLAVVALAVTDGPLFDLFARPADKQDGRLRGLFGFAASAAILAVAVEWFDDVPFAAFVATVLLVAFGNLLSEAALQREWGSHDGWFVIGGGLGAAVGFAVVRLADVGANYAIGTLLVFVVAAALSGGLVRSMLFPRDDPPVMLSVALVLSLLHTVGLQLAVGEALFAVAVTAGVGGISYALETASVEGMIAGILLGLLTFVLGGPGWFLVLLAFFAIGGLSTKYEYDRKVERDIAEDDEGARGGENVLANSSAPIASVFGYAAASGPTEPLFAVAFAGALATALGDTLSSEIGGVYDNPRLITTLERVPAGTDGAVTWQGELAGLTGTAIIAGLGVGVLDFDPIIGGAVVLAGFAGMTADSLLGATVEGPLLGNEGVNFLATVVGCVVGGLLAFALGSPL